HLFFFTAPSPPELYTLSLHDALPILAAREQLAVELEDRLVDPALGMAGPRLGAGAHHVGEGCVGRDLEDALPDGAGEALGQVERSEEHTSELQSLTNLVCRLLLEKKQ